MANQQNTTRLPTGLRKNSPAEQLNWLLSRSKHWGTDFDLAWKSAWKHIVWPHDTSHRQQWKDTLLAEREMWRRAYEGQEVGAGSGHKALANREMREALDSLLSGPVAA